MLDRISKWFAAGAAGGLANALAVSAYRSVTAGTFLGVKLDQGLSPEMIYERVVWGGIYGAVFIIPVIFKNFLIRGLVYSLAPTLLQLFVIMPSKGQGLLGLTQGNFTPVQVALFNAVWGVAAVLWLKLTDAK